MRPVDSRQLAASWGSVTLGDVLEGDAEIEARNQLAELRPQIARAVVPVVVVVLALLLADR